MTIEEIREAMNKNEFIDGTLYSILLYYEVEKDINFFRECIHWIEKHFNIYSRIEYWNGKKQIQEIAMFSKKNDIFNPIVQISNADHYLKEMNLRLDLLEEKEWY